MKVDPTILSSDAGDREVADAVQRLMGDLQREFDDVDFRMAVMANLVVLEAARSCHDGDVHAAIAGVVGTLQEFLGRLSPPAGPGPAWPG